MDAVPDAVPRRRTAHDVELGVARATHQHELGPVREERKDGGEERLARRLEERAVDEDEGVALGPRRPRIDPAAVDPDDVELLQDMVTAAVNQAVDQAQQLAASKLGAVSGGLGGPGGPLGGLGLPGM